MQRPQYEREFDEAVKLCRELGLVEVQNGGELVWTERGRLVVSLALAYASSLGLLAPAP